MEICYLTLKQMLTMFFLILVGFILRKKSVLPKDADTVLAKLETCVFIPAVLMFNQMTQCTVETFKTDYTLIMYGGIIITAAILMAYPLSKLFVRKINTPGDAYLRDIYKYALTFGNFGLMGNFIILGVWGSEVFYKYSLFTFFPAILSSSWGLYVLVPKDKNAGILENLKKGFINPPVIGLVAGMLIGLLGIGKYIPDFALKAIENAGSCQGPIAMLLAGFVIGGFDFKQLLTNKKVYAATLLRLIIIPAILMLIMKLLGMSDETMTLALITFATPLGMNTIVFPAAYGGDTKPGAAMAMISHVAAVATIPLMYLIFIVLL